MFGKLMSAIRGHANDLGEKVEAEHQIPILRQDIRDMESAVSGSKSSLRDVMADEVIQKKNVAQLESRIADLNSQAEKCLIKGEEALALKVLDNVGTLEPDLELAQQILAKTVSASSTLRSKVKSHEDAIKQLKSQINHLAAQDKLNKATSKMNDALGSSASSVGDASGRLKKIQDNLDRATARNEASEQMANEESGADLDAELRKAGVTGGPSSDDRLAALKAKMKK